MNTKTQVTDQQVNDILKLFKQNKYLNLSEENKIKIAIAYGQVLANNKNYGYHEIKTIFEVDKVYNLLNT